MVPITGRAGTFLEFLKLQSQSKLNPNQIQSIFCSPCFLYLLAFFLYLQGQSELCGSYHLLQSCFLFSSVSMANLSRLVATIFSSLALISSSVYMAKLSHLIAASFSSLALLSSSVSTFNLRCLLVTTFSSLSFLSNSLSTPCFNF